MLMNYARACNPYSGFSAPDNRTSATECAEKALFSGLFRHVLHYGLGIKDGRKIDCCCGSGGMFVQSEWFAESHSHSRGVISVYGQEANPDTWKMAKMNMAIRGIDADLGPYNADTFTNDLHPTLKADYILANPPFNYHPWGQEQLKDDKRWKYGLPPARNANYAWIQHMIFHPAPQKQKKLQESFIFKVLQLLFLYFVA